MVSSPASPPSPAQQRRTIYTLATLSWLALAYTWLQAHPQPGPGLPDRLVEKLPLCLFREGLHWPCPFCGLTRGFTMVARGDWQAAGHYHPLALPLYGLTLLIAFMGPLFPAFAWKILQKFTTRPWLIGMGIVLAFCWLWKLTHDPGFW